MEPGRHRSPSLGPPALNHIGVNLCFEVELHPLADLPGRDLPQVGKLADVPGRNRSLAVLRQDKSRLLRGIAVLKGVLLHRLLLLPFAFLLSIRYRRVFCKSLKTGPKLAEIA